MAKGTGEVVLFVSFVVFTKVSWSRVREYPRWEVEFTVHTRLDDGECSILVVFDHHVEFVFEVTFVFRIHAIGANWVGEKTF